MPFFYPTAIQMCERSSSVGPALGANIDLVFAADSHVEGV